MANETKVYVAVMCNEPFTTLEDAINAVANSLREHNERHERTGANLPCFVHPHFGWGGDKEWRVCTLNYKGNLIYRTIREKTLRDNVNAEVLVYPIDM